VPPNPLAMKIPAHAPPTFTAQRCTCQSMAPTRRTSEWRGQKINVQHDSTLQGNCSHRIRGTTTTLEATLFAFLFHFFRFHPFTTNVTRVLSLEAIKGEAGAASNGGQRREDPATIARTHRNRNHTTTTQETWDLLPLSKVCNPYHEHPGARQHEPQRNPLDVGPFMSEPVYILVSALHTIRV
jgi:hypothetical protein